MESGTVPQPGVNMRVAVLRAMMIVVAGMESFWGVAFYLHPGSALGALGRVVLDPVIARQYPLYIASAALAYGIAAVSPRRYAGVIWICVAQRVVETVVAAIDWKGRAIASSAFVRLAALELFVAFVLSLALSTDRATMPSSGALDPRDRGLVRLLRGFGGLELFWFLASTVFVQLGSRLLGWKLQDPYTTQQQGIALLVIGLVCILAASDVVRYRLLVAVPIASQLIGIANSFNEIHLGSIGWTVAAVQWTIESTIAFGFVWFSRRHLGFAMRRPRPSSDLAA
jgi:hypothetical protein